MNNLALMLIGALNDFPCWMGVPVPWIQKPGINVTSETPMLPILRMYLQLECHMQYNTGNKVAKPGLPPVYLLFTLVSWGEASKLCDEFPVVNWV